MIEGSLKFHSEKMSFEKFEDKISEDTFILLAFYQESRFSRALVCV